MLVLLQEASRIDINTALLAGGGASVAINAWFLKRLVARQDDFSTRLRKVENKVTAVFTRLGLLSPSDEEDTDG